MFDLFSKITPGVSWAFIACGISFFEILVCSLVEKIIAKRKKHNKAIPFSERYPKLNMLMGLGILVIIVSIVYILVYYVLYFFLGGGGTAVGTLLVWLKKEMSKLDAVVVVALITGAVSIVGVIISSIVAKMIDFKKENKSI